jgi:hypothetical protein
MYDTVKGSDWLGELHYHKFIFNIFSYQTLRMFYAILIHFQGTKTLSNICAEKHQKPSLSLRTMVYLSQELKMERFTSAPLEDRA